MVDQFKKILDELSRKIIDGAKVAHIPKPKHKTMKNVFQFLKKLIRPVRNFLAGENKVGEIMHGILDLLPIPNQAFAKLFKALLSGDKRAAKDEVGNILTPRNIVASIASLLIYFKVITLAQLIEFATIVNKVLEALA